VAGRDRSAYPSFQPSSRIAARGKAARTRGPGPSRAAAEQPATVAGESIQLSKSLLTQHQGGSDPSRPRLRRSPARAGYLQRRPELVNCVAGTGLLGRAAGARQPRLPGGRSVPAAGRCLALLLWGRRPPERASDGSEVAEGAVQVIVDEQEIVGGHAGLD